MLVSGKAQSGQNLSLSRLAMAGGRCSNQEFMCLSRWRKLFKFHTYSAYVMMFITDDKHVFTKIYFLEFTEYLKM